MAMAKTTTAAVTRRTRIRRDSIGLSPHGVT
jgi:hypothetical protein